MKPYWLEGYEQAQVNLNRPPQRLLCTARTKWPRKHILAMSQLVLAGAA
jgi:hypothetical protein